MRVRWLIVACACWILLSCAGPGPQMNKEELFQEVVSSMPDYQDFLTVDELHGALESLKSEYPELVSLTVLGETELGRPIYEFRIGTGTNHALLYGFPHPNEPIGSMMLHHLTRELA